jgi:hypothetical protein
MIKELKVGMRVKGQPDRRDNYTGTVVYVTSDEAGIKRDDGKTGGGKHIDGYGDAWVVFKYNGYYKSSCSNGAYLKNISITSWKEKWS